MNKYVDSQTWDFHVQNGYSTRQVLQEMRRGDLSSVVNISLGMGRSCPRKLSDKEQYACTRFMEMFKDEKTHYDLYVTVSSLDVKIPYENSDQGTLVMERHSYRRDLIEAVLRVLIIIEPNSTVWEDVDPCGNPFISIIKGFAGWELKQADAVAERLNAFKTALGWECFEVDLIENLANTYSVPESFINSFYNGPEMGEELNKFSVDYGYLIYDGDSPTRNTIAILLMLVPGEPDDTFWEVDYVDRHFSMPNPIRARIEKAGIIEITRRF